MSLCIYITDSIPADLEQCYQMVACYFNTLWIKFSFWEDKNAFSHSRDNALTIFAQFRYDYTSIIHTLIGCQAGIIRAHSGCGLIQWKAKTEPIQDDLWSWQGMLSCNFLNVFYIILLNTDGFSSDFVGSSTLGYNSWVKTAFKSHALMFMRCVMMKYVFLHLAECIERTWIGIKDYIPFS